MVKKSFKCPYCLDTGKVIMIGGPSYPCICKAKKIKGGTWSLIP